MLTRALRLLIATVAFVALAVPAAAVAGPRQSGVDQGVVQSVDTSEIVLRTLDGGIVTFSLVPRTVVRLNGDRAGISDIYPGYVARVAHDAKGHAVGIEAFGATATSTDRGVVTAISKSTITLRIAGGGSLTLSLDASTRFKLHGAPSRRGAVRPGAQVAVAHASDAPATVVNVLKRAGA